MYLAARLISLPVSRDVGDSVAVLVVDRTQIDVVDKSGMRELVMKESSSPKDLRTASMRFLFTPLV